jgi:TetR/AcrR family transcriptional repressor of nem operon
MSPKEKIIQTAFTIFLDKKYKSAAYSEFIKATDVSKGAFYHYLKNK